MIKENILSLSYWLKENYNTVIFLLIAIMSIFVFIIMEAMRKEKFPVVISKKNINLKNAIYICKKTM